MNKKEIIRLSLLATIVGVFSGAAIALFLICLKKAANLNMEYGWLILLLPFSGALMSYIYERFGGNSNKGNNIIIENINGSDEKINFIMAPLVFMGTVLAHFFGASVGREGTGVQLGGTISSFVAERFKLSKEQRKILLISGVAAGFSSVFGTPIAGTLFAVEVSSVGRIKYDSFLPAFVAALVGDGVVKLIGVGHTHFPTLAIEEVLPMTIIKVVIMAIFFGMASRGFSTCTHWFKKIFSKYIKKAYIKTFVGGAIMVAVTLLLGNRVYNGLSLPLLEEAFIGGTPTFAFLIKLVLTALCLGAGYQGGEVTPLFVIGSTLGGALAVLLGLPIAFAAALGLIGVFAGATKTPIASLLLGIELFGASNIIFILIVCIISVIASGKVGIYGSQVWDEF